MGTTEVDPKLLFPVEGLVAYLKDNHGLVGDGQYYNALHTPSNVVCSDVWSSLVSELPLIRQFKHGQSNPTYYIEYGGAKLVLRKKPVSHTVEPSIRDTTELRTPF